MYTLIVLTSIGCGIAVGVWSYAYRLGIRHGRSTSVPFRLIDELLDHKIHCCEQDPATARVELENALGIEEWESQSLLQQVLNPSRPLQRQRRDVQQETVKTTQKVA
jgi:hypothetical protein